MYVCMYVCMYVQYVCMYVYNRYKDEIIIYMFYVYLNILINTYLLQYHIPTSLSHYTIVMHVYDIIHNMTG